MTLRESWGFEGFLKNVVQFGWLETPNNSSPFLLDRLEIEYIKFHGSS